MSKHFHWNRRLFTCVSPNLSVVVSAAEVVAFPFVLSWKDKFADIFNYRSRIEVIVQATLTYEIYFMDFLFVQKANNATKKNHEWPCDFECYEGGMNMRIFFFQLAVLINCDEEVPFSSYKKERVILCQGVQHL